MYYGERKVSFDSRLFRLRQRLESGLTMALMIFLFVFTLSVIVYIADIEAHLLGSASQLNDLLAASRETPWGIVTSLFVHANEGHLSNNMIALFFFLVFLVATNALLPKAEMKKRIFSSSLAIFVVPVVLNVFWISLFPEVKIMGSSGIVYALEGSCLGFSMHNALELKRPTTYTSKERRITLASSLSNIVVCVILLLNLIVSPETFLGSKFEVVVWLHALSFCGGLLSAFLYTIYPWTGPESAVPDKRSKKGP
ncbi:MAG: rhomboid family intramembrane serine protease [Candidatus Bathyarchaeota archaeon]|nr:rhomboid family intramembrane serine protease [Candidatus Bathyarchaeota archaeon]